MAKKDKPDMGEKMMADIVDGKTGLAAMDSNQLAHLGGTLDPIDTEDFSDADFGNVLPDDFDDRSAALAQNQADLKKDDDDEADDKDSDADADAEADDDAESKDTEDKDEADDDAESEGDDDETSEDESDDKADDADTTDESDDDADTKADTPDEKDEDKPTKRREQQIPKSRFDEVNSRRKVAEEKLARIEAEDDAAKVDDFDFDAAEVTYMDLLLAGKTKEAVTQRGVIRSAEQSAYLAHANEVAPTAVKEGAEQTAIDALVDDYETRYDGLNPDKKGYQDDLMDEVASMYAGYMTTGFTRPEAFKLALDNVVKIYELTEAGEPAATEKDDKKPVKKPIKKTKEKLAAAKKQPANPADAKGDPGDDAKPLDLDTMSDEEIDALPKATLARLRGDLV